MSSKPFDAADYPKGFAGFWDGLRAKTIRFPHCRACGKVHWYPMARCPHCYSDDLDWQAVSGAGTLYSWTTVLRTMSPDQLIAAFELAWSYWAAVVEIRPRRVETRAEAKVWGTFAGIDGGSGVLEIGRAHV